MQPSYPLFAPALACGLILLAAGGCAKSPDEQENTALSAANETVSADRQAAQPSLPDYANMAIDIPAPGEPGGLPDDRTPLAEGPIAPGSAQEAGSLLERYFALLGQRRFGDAALLWEGKAPDLVAQFSNYVRIAANIGAPGRIEAGAGQRYVEIPVQLYGRLRDGTVVSGLGKAVLHRTGAIDGATEDQKRWHITRIDVTPEPYIRNGDAGAPLNRIKAPAS